MINSFGDQVDAIDHFEQTERVYGNVANVVCYRHDAPPYLKLATAVDDFGTTVPIGWPALASRARHLEIV
jgi:hypothetical protein